MFKEEVGEADSGRITDNDSCDFRDDVVSTGDARDDEMGDDWLCMIVKIIVR